MAVASGKDNHRLTNPSCWDLCRDKRSMKDIFCRGFDPLPEMLLFWQAWGT